MRHAVAHLRRADPVMRHVIEQVGPCRFRVLDQGTHFEFLARAIIGQQLSGRAAATIYSRVRALAGNGPLRPQLLLTLPDEELRAAGLSRQKLAAVRDLAAHAIDGRLLVERLHRLDDDEIFARLVQVRGIGTWTVQMFLMFRLGRPDVLPTSDLGVRKGVQRAYRLRATPPPRRVEQIGRHWAPYRSFASWYLWRLLEVEPVTGRDA